MTRYWLALVLVVAARSASAQPAGTDFFESRIRPVLAQRCYGCHSSKLAAPKSELTLDTKAGVLKGGRLGPAVVPEKPDESLLLRALRYSDPNAPHMPPSGKLPDAIIADFEQWIASGAPDPRGDVGTTAADPRQYKGMSIEEGRRWWAFQPVQAHAPAKVKAAAWPRTKTDTFILAKLEEKRLTPSPAADRRSLAIRTYLDLVGYRPTYEEIEAFVSDRSPNAYEALIDRLLASPRYGERWARRWMDVARYGEDNPTSEATNPPYPFAWRYRDWMIEAINADVPYDKFVTLQLAADLIPGVSRNDLRALGYLGAAPTYHKDLRLSADVIGTFFTDDWDERIDAVTRGVLGLSAGCARCHDHKFDPITQKDYYGLMGVFASTTRAERPMFAVDSAVESRYLTIQRRLTDLVYSLNLIVNETSTFTNPAEKEVQWRAEVASLKAEATSLLEPYPALLKSLERFWAPPGTDDGGAGGAWTIDGSVRQCCLRGRSIRRRLRPSYTFPIYKAGEARDVPLLKAGNYAAPGEVIPRRFLAVLASDDGRFVNGSGRKELAERLFTDARALAARVIVNRVWGWHFGRAIVATPSDFGTQGERPTHLELLDDLAARFVENGWSLKWLHKEIMRSAAYQQSSAPRADALGVDQANALLWRMNPRRLDVEAYRDSLIRAAGLLDEEMGGISGNLDANDFYRRTVYGQLSRQKRATMLALFDFPDPLQTMPDRETTVTSLQQIFTLNSAFMQKLAAAVAGKAKAVQGDAEQIAVLYRHILSRTPTTAELKSALQYLQTRHARALCPGPAGNQRGDLSAMTLKLTRREMIEALGGGLGVVGLASAFAGLSERRVQAAGAGHYAGTALPGKAKHMIMLYMTGGPSQLDMFDYKPALYKYIGQRPAAVDLRTERPTAGLMPTPFEFKRYGRGGVEVSELLPNIAGVIDDICVIRSMYYVQPDPLAGSQSVLHWIGAVDEAVDWFLGHIWIRYRKRKPALVCRSRSSSDRRRPPHTRRLPADRVSGRELCRRRSRSRSHHSQLAKQDGGRRGSAAGSRRTPDAQQGLQCQSSAVIPTRGANQVDGICLQDAIRGAGGVRRAQGAAVHTRGVRKLAVRELVPARPAAGRGRSAIRPHRLSRRTELGYAQRRRRQSPKALPGYGSRVRGSCS